MEEPNYKEILRRLVESTPAERVKYSLWTKARQALEHTPKTDLDIDEWLYKRYGMPRRRL